MLRARGMNARSTAGGPIDEPVRETIREPPAEERLDLVAQ
jgi:hypothetical protein